MRYLTALCAAVLIGLAGLPAQATPSALCGEREDFVETLDRKYDERPAAMGLSASGGVLEIFVSRKGTWTILVTRPNGMACVMSAGESWETLPNMKAGLKI